MIPMSHRYYYTNMCKVIDTKYHISTYMISISPTYKYANMFKVKRAPGGRRRS